MLALRAAAAGVALERLVVYQPPFVVNTSGHVPPPDFGAHVNQLVSEGHTSKAVSYFMRRGMGAPGVFVGALRAARPIRSNLKAVAHTLPYDHAVMGGTNAGAPLAPEPWSSIALPTLVVDGGKSPAQLHRAADQLAGHMPNAERRTLEGQSHNVSMKALAPVLDEFFTRR